MMEALKVFWRVVTDSGEDRTWFPHGDGKCMRRWNFQRHEYDFKPISPEESAIKSASRETNAMKATD